MTGLKATHPSERHGLELTVPAAVDHAMGAAHAPVTIVAAMGKRAATSTSQLTGDITLPLRVDRAANGDFTMPRIPNRFLCFRLNRLLCSTPTGDSNE